MGGSQGALRINEVMVDLIMNGGGLPPGGSQLLYITGNLYYERVRKQLKGGLLSGVVLMPYLNDMPSALAVADLVISRAGGHGSGRDNCAGGVPALLIPSPNVAYNHQYFNARLLEKEGGPPALSRRKILPRPGWRK